jgi:hypothetical protein
MRFALIGLPLTIFASPALAQQAPPPAAADMIQLPPELMDPKWADRLTDAMVAMSKVFLELPVGEVEAAIEGRQPTAAEKRRTVRSETRMSEREIRQQIEEARPAMHAGMRALASALPAMMKGMSEAQREMERAMSNVPRPDYPRR